MKPKHSIILVILCFGFLKTKAQHNLVLNGSFEDTIPTIPSPYCISNSTGICMAQNWFQPMTYMGMVSSGSSDYFYPNSPDPTARGPQNGAGYQYPKDGEAYVGIAIYVHHIRTSPYNNYREYIEGALSEKLQAGKKYCLSFYVSATTSLVLLYGCNNMGAYFSNDSLLVAFSPPNYRPDPIPVIPQVLDTTIITDTTNWTLVSGEFTAQGGEQFITIGNFFSDSLTRGVFLENGAEVDGYAYYYIDNVSLVACGEDAAKLAPTSIPNIFTPNNDGVNDVFFIQNLQPNTQLSIFNRWGNTVYKTNNYQNNWQASNVPAGVYYYLLQTTEGKAYKGFVQVIK